MRITISNLVHLSIFVLGCVIAGLVGYKIGLNIPIKKTEIHYVEKRLNSVDPLLYYQVYDGDFYVMDYQIGDTFSVVWPICRIYINVNPDPEIEYYIDRWVLVDRKVKK